MTFYIVTEEEFQSLAPPTTGLNSNPRRLPAGRVVYTLDGTVVPPILSEHQPFTLAELKAYLAPYEPARSDAEPPASWERLAWAAVAAASSGAAIYFLS